jgi:LmbE family N-acetylglucosaminyl deacetylase
MLPLLLGTSADAHLRVLCLGAHSDDIEIGCGATILRLLTERTNCSVHWVVLSSDPERGGEARRSAADLLQGARESTVLVREFRESYFPYVAAQVKDFFEVLKQMVNPDLILTHRRGDAHQDHRLVAELTWNTYRNHLILEYEIPKYEGDLGHPEVYVPISRETAERKKVLLLRHFVTQQTRSWFRPEVFDGLMTLRGIECNAPDGYAEAFHLRKCVL